MKNISFISYYPFDKIKYEQFGVDILKEKLNLSVIDVSQIYFKNLKINSINSTFKNIFNLYNKNDIKKILN